MVKKGMKGFLKSAGKQEENEGADKKTVTKKATPPLGRSQDATPPPVASTGSSSGPINPINQSDGDDSGDEESGPETRGKMLQRHKKEALAFKKSMQRAGKKTKDEIATLTRELEARHERELKELDARPAASEVEEGVVGLAGLSVSNEHTEEAAAAAAAAKKPSKAQARREKLSKREAERASRIADELANLGPSARAVEEEALQELIRGMGLHMVEIRADGHCLYRSLEDQLLADATSSPKDYQELRRLAAEHIQQHKDEFEPFIYDADVGTSADVQIAEYCSEVASTASWGGEVEIQALAAALQRPIQVHAVGLPPVTAGESYPGTALQLCYLQHAFGLGAHYNSLRPAPAPADPE